MSQIMNDVGRFLVTVREALLFRAAPDAPSHQMAHEIFQALDGPLRENAIQPCHVAACRHLSTAFDLACSGETPVAHAARALRTIEPAFRWWTRADADTYGASFADSHANATIIGPTGLANHDTVQVGVSLVGPKTRYPDHDHPPEEVYLVMSPGEWCNADVSWHEPGMGGIVHNPPGITHAMRTQDDPLLAVWCLM